MVNTIYIPIELKEKINKYGNHYNKLYEICIICITCIICKSEGGINKNRTETTCTCIIAHRTLMHCLI